MNDSFVGSRGSEYHPLLSIAIVFAVSATGFAAELAAADALPWGTEARGVIAVLAGAAAALWLTLGKGAPLSGLGLRRPRRWLTVPFWVLGIFFVFVVAQALVPQILAPVFESPAPDMSRYDFIRGNALAAVSMALLLPLTAAIPEEFVYRGFLFYQFERLFQRTRVGPALAVLCQALVFGSVHFQWGPGGVLMATIMGIVWGAAYLLCGRNLWIVIMAHSAAHIALILQIYTSPPPT